MLRRLIPKLLVIYTFLSAIAKELEEEHFKVPRATYDGTEVRYRSSRLYSAADMAWKLLLSGKVMSGRWSFARPPVASAY